MTACENPKRPWLFGRDMNKKTVYVYRPPCGNWKCIHCAHQKRLQWVARVAYGLEIFTLQGDTWQFVTLTSHRKLKTFNQTLYVWRKAWPRLYARMKRRADTIRYVLIPEKHDDERLHAHMIVNRDFGTRFYKDGSAAVGLGYIAENEPCDDPVKGALYCSKYVSKGIGVEVWPKYLRRVQTSQNWPEEEFDTKIWADDVQFEKTTRRQAESSYNLYTHSAGYTVVLLGTTEDELRGAETQEMQHA